MRRWSNGLKKCGHLTRTGLGPLAHGVVERLRDDEFPPVRVIQDRVALGLDAPLFVDDGCVDGACDRVDDGEAVDAARPYLDAVVGPGGLVLGAPRLCLGDAVAAPVRAASGAGVQADAQGAPRGGLGLGDVLIGRRHGANGSRTARKAARPSYTAAVAMRPSSLMPWS